jgi:hypothetical protein
MKKRKIVLPSKRSFKSDDDDLTIPLGLEENKRLLREGDKDIVLNVSNLFDKERNESNRYKIYGKVKMVFKNVYSGTTTYEPLLKNLSLVGDGTGSSVGYLPYNEFAFRRNDIVREVNIPEETNDFTSFNQNITLSGDTGHTAITAIEAPGYNWNFCLSYVHDSDLDFPMKYTLSGGIVYNFTAKDGIPFRVEDDDNYYRLVSPIEHGMLEGEYIIISGGTLDSSVQVSERTFNIESVGVETHGSNKYIINLLKTELPSGTTLSSVVFGRRCVDILDIDGTTSTYYVHKHKTLTEASGCVIDKAGFESPIWSDERKILFQNPLGENDVIVERNRMESHLFDFTDPFILEGIENNLGYTPTEIYITTVFRNKNGYFNYPPKVGYKFNFHDSWIDEHFSDSVSEESVITQSPIITNTSGYTFYGGDEIPVGTELTGAFIEYNDSEMRERVISESLHKITIRDDIFDHGQTGDVYGFSGATPTNPFGLFYQPHHRVKLRELSPYIEESDTDEVYNLPENTKYYEKEGVWKWRDLYEQGFIDQDGYGVDHPFVNNTHYVKKDINFYFRNEQHHKNKTDGLIAFGYLDLFC